MDNQENVIEDKPLADLVGDLSRVLSELDKKSLALPAVHIATAIAMIEAAAG